MMQIWANALVTAAIYSLVGLGFAILYETGKWFNFSQALIITIGAYAMFGIAGMWQAPMWLAIPLSVIVACAFGMAFEVGLFGPLRRRNVSSWGLLLVSLGVYTVLQNSISLGFGDNTKSVRTDAILAGHQFFGAYITNIQLITLVVCFGMFVLILLLLRATDLGRAIRGVSSNPELCTIVGINFERTMLWAVVIASGLGALAGVLVALDTDMTPTMGFPLLMSGVIVMIVGGIGSYRTLFGTAFLLAMTQHFVAYYFDSKWMDAVAFFILIAFLIWKPLGFSGRRLKKIEI